MKPLRQLVVLVSLATFALAGAQNVFPKIEDLMGAAQFQATGLHKLTAEELAELNSWMQIYSAALLKTYGGASGSIDRSPAAPPSASGVITSRIDGTFEGWDGETVFKLTNGQIWQQVQYAYLYHYAYGPEVTIIQSAGGYVMSVDGVKDSIRVRRLR